MQGTLTIEDHDMCNYDAALCDQTASPTTCTQMADGADGCDPS